MNTEPKSQPTPLANPTERGDIDLIERVCQRDQGALALLYERYGHAVYSMALYVVGDTASAEEITQDVFMRLWHRAAEWDVRRAKLSTWLLTIARNAAIDRLRKEKRRPACTEFDNVFNLLTVEPSTSHLGILLQQLPKEQQEVIYLSFFGGMSQREIAEDLAIPLGTIKTRMRLGLEKLRKWWTDK
jgi:RNA polymerase sigma-70 factor, ECF subfamily